MARITLNNIRKVYENGFTAVRDFDLDIADKEFMVIVGPSGCGKTTTLRMIAGLEDITEGTISIAGKPVNDITPKDRDVAMVFQSYALYPHMTVFDNMAFSLKLRKTSKNQIAKRVNEVADLLSIKEHLHKKPHSLSGGQRQRVALGRVMVRKPAAFLFDEPLSNLDANLRQSTRRDLKLLHHDLQTTAIYVTHDQAEAMTLGDRICVMYNGVIQQVASPMEVYNKPVNRFVAGFLGTPPMNFFDGKIEIDGSGFIFVFCGGRLELPASIAEKIKDYSAGEMVLGIRPEDISEEVYEDLPEAYIDSRVDIVEPLGDRMDVYLRSADNRRFAVNLKPNRVFEPGDKIRLYIDIRKIHIFKPGDTGLNVSL